LLVAKALLDGATDRIADFQRILSKSMSLTMYQKRCAMLRHSLDIDRTGQNTDWFLGKAAVG
jgi:hypothetical protein